MAVLRKFCLGAAVAISLAGCNVQESLDDAKAQISVFHADLDAENYDSIWKETAPEFRNVSKPDELKQLLAAVHRKLGKVKQSKQTGWNRNVTTQGNFTVIGMETTFERGVGQETFTYVRKGKELLLAGYNINSNAMMVN